MERRSWTERLRRHTQRTGSCLLWTGAVAGNGQPVIQDDVGRMRAVHRLVYEAAAGGIPDGAAVVRTCRNRLCVAAEHLALRSPTEI